MTKPDDHHVYVFERFSEPGRHVLLLAQVEARMCGHGHVGPEHLLLGILHEGANAAAAILGDLGVTLDEARDHVQDNSDSDEEDTSEYPVFTSSAKDLLERARITSQELGNDYIGPEHLLLGLVRTDAGSPDGAVLARLGIDPALVDAHVTDRIAPPSGAGQGRIGIVPVGPWHPTAFAGADARPTQRRGSCASCGRDLRDVGRYVAQDTAAICQGCVLAANDALEEATDEVHPRPLTATVCR
ncbi:MAG TPA: Clp protease N-terminal domain-containing protein [Acidimicrobiales bacterium]|nr:Clp protease N-terminal domain-containing protein [Acidimicrobiales bacterium]